MTNVYLFLILSGALLFLFGLGLVFNLIALRTHRDQIPWWLDDTDTDTEVHS